MTLRELDTGTTNTGFTDTITPTQKSRSTAQSRNKNRCALQNNLISSDHSAKQEDDFWELTNEKRNRCH